ncbi:hypothetical protein SCHPADRAFT_944654 [Schizopora paradoxa]|uniref:Uncharacterized protein n=1 Tax=Schizopora paradoxa TaxID=27342 RepID=A0A0H2RA03_9AGAM|nr:hypothetical protein SCHPADRAFT_944654 [Schizopora paradoxa]
MDTRTLSRRRLAFGRRRRSRAPSRGPSRECSVLDGFDENLARGSKTKTVTKVAMGATAAMMKTVTMGMVMEEDGDDDDDDDGDGHEEDGDGHDDVDEEEEDRDYEDRDGDNVKLEFIEERKLDADQSMIETKGVWDSGLSGWRTSCRIAQRVDVRMGEWTCGEA